MAIFLVILLCSYIVCDWIFWLFGIFSDFWWGVEGFLGELGVCVGVCGDVWRILWCGGMVFVLSWFGPRFEFGLVGFMVPLGPGIAIQRTSVWRAAMLIGPSDWELFDPWPLRPVRCW